MTSAPFDAVLLIAFGGPPAPEHVRPFIENVTRGRQIPPERLVMVEQQYAQIGGRSPLNDLTFAQARALEAVLAARGRGLPVRVGMRNWHPYLHETLAELATMGARRVFGIILSAARSEPSWERYIKDVQDARTRLSTAPDVRFAAPWSTEPGFLDAVAHRVRAALDQVPPGERAWVPMIFTAHSIPIAVADASTYVADIAGAAHAVVERLGHPRYSIAYQSRSGHPRDPWLEPDVNDVLRRLGADGEKHAVIVPIGFVVDHVEVLYDLDVQARATAELVGLTLHRAEAVNDHPAFIGALAELVARAA